MSPALRPFTFDLAYLINESATLKRFVNMGVDVYRWNQPIDKGKYVLTLDFERDCLQHLAFLNELGIKNKQLAEFLTFNPWIFKESLEDLRVRIDYLSSKGFSSEDLQEICTRAPYLLNLSTKTIDTKLNWFQKKFHLSEIQSKDFVLRAPKLLTLPLKGISDTYFNMNQQLAFEHEELHQIFHVYPKLFIYDYKLIELNFDFLFNEMQMPRSSFVQYPPILKQSFSTTANTLSLLEIFETSPIRSKQTELCLLERSLFEDERTFLSTCSENLVTTVSEVHENIVNVTLSLIYRLIWRISIDWRSSLWTERMLSGDWSSEESRSVLFRVFEHLTQCLSKLIVRRGIADRIGHIRRTLRIQAQ